MDAWRPAEVITADRTPRVVEPLPPREAPCDAAPVEAIEPETAPTVAQPLITPSRIPLGSDRGGPMALGAAASPPAAARADGLPLLITDISDLPLRETLVRPARVAGRNASLRGPTPWGRVHVIVAAAALPVLLASVALALIVLGTRPIPPAAPSVAVPMPTSVAAAAGVTAPLQALVASLPDDQEAEAQKLIAIAASWRKEVADLDARAAAIAARGTPASLDDLLKVFGDMSALMSAYRDSYARASTQMRQVDTKKLSKTQTLPAVIQTYDQVATLYGQAADAARDRNATRLGQLLKDIETYKTTRAAETRRALCAEALTNRATPTADCR